MTPDLTASKDQNVGLAARRYLDDASEAEWVVVPLIRRTLWEITLALSTSLDFKITVTSDSNVWNGRFDRDVCLLDALPSSRFFLFIPRHVEIELEAVPDAEAESKVWSGAERGTPPLSNSTTCDVSEELSDDGVLIGADWDPGLH